ncbi:MAG: winged helix-turn-helix domain-containing protein [Anaerolineales bacterium]
MAISKDKLKETETPFISLATEVVNDLVKGRCAAITGLSNTGKSTVMRALAAPEIGELYQDATSRPIHLLYVDCNRAVAITSQAFYEVVIRSILERLEPRLRPDLGDSLRRHHQQIIEAESAFSASLAFNLGLTELGEGLGRDLVLLIDEFDEFYRALEDRALVNMRALRDRYSDRLSYVIATVRRLPQLRGSPVEGEFAEMFSRSTHRMPLLKRAEADQLLVEMDTTDLTEEQRVQCFEMAGGHPGLLIACALALTTIAAEGVEPDMNRVVQAPQPGAECLKIWTQLTEEEQTTFGNLVLQPEASLPLPHLGRLEVLGLLDQGDIFSPIFERFVQRRMRAPGAKDLGIHVDHDSGDVWVEGVRIPVLTDLEFRLMELLDERLDKLTDKYTIVTEVWGEDYLEEVDDARVEKLISRLRSKIEPDPGNPRYLITRRGRGYKLLSRPHVSQGDEDEQD